MFTKSVTLSEVAGAGFTACTRRLSRVIAEVNMSGPCVFLTLIHVYFSLIYLCNIFQCEVDKTHKLIPFFSTYIIFILFLKIGDSLLVANRRSCPICQVTKVPFKRRNAKIILCWFFFTYIHNFSLWSDYSIVAKSHDIE
jgi:hypothetical protein